MNTNKEYEVQKIREYYTEKEPTELETLKALDAKVKSPANVFAYVFGGISSIIMGLGMSLVMTDIGGVLGIENTMITGIIIGTIGMLGAIIDYPVYKKILGRRRKKYSDEIIALSDNIIKG